MALQPRNLVRTSQLVVDHFDNGSDKVAFTFASYIQPGTEPDVEGLGFGGAFLLRQGFDVVAFKPAFNSWYQDVPGHWAAIAEALRPYRLRVGYGVSMGAYGAALCSARLAMQRVFAISPLYVIGTSWDRRWSADIEGQSLIPELSAACTYFIAYDPQHMDAQHADLYAQHAPVVRVPIPGAAHRIPALFNQSGNLKGLAASILDKGVVPHELLPTSAA